MKKRIRRNVRTRRRELVIRPEKGEALNPAQAAWLKEHPHRTFLEFRHTYGQNTKDVTLYYDVDGLVSLKTYLKKTRVDETILARLMVDVALSQIHCAKGGGRYFSMLFDSKDVFVDADGHLAFTYVPLDGMSFQIENTPLLLLRSICNKNHLKPVDENTRVLADRLAEYVLNENEVFSLNHFRSFIGRECWINIDSDGTVSRIEGSRIGSEIDTSGYAGDGGTALRDIPVIPAPREVGDYVLIRSGRERFGLIRDEVVLLGRASDCKVRVLGNSLIGRHHLALQCTAAGLVIQDLGSVNGTSVQGGRLDPSYSVRIQYGTHFMVADEDFVVGRS